jgi:heme-degrading monooxygenase HmoA
MANAYVSINWHVKRGSEDEFLELWGGALEWLEASFARDGFERARLVRDEADPSHFVSFIEWRDRAAIERWDAHPEKPRRQAALAQLCDDVSGCIGTDATRLA